MNYPEKGAIVKVKWVDAFSYNDESKYCVKTTLGEWNGISEDNINGKMVKIVDLLQETCEYDISKPLHDQEGTRIPLDLILNIARFKLDEPIIFSSQFSSTDCVSMSNPAYKMRITGSNVDQ